MKDSIVKKEHKPERSYGGPGTPRGPNKPSRRFTKKRKNTQKFASRTPKFEGSEANLKGMVYTLGFAQGEMFTKTTRDISLYVGKTYKNGGDIKKTIDKLELIDIPPPADLDDTIATKAEQRIWERD